MSKYSIKDLSKGRCAIKNDASVDELRAVLCKAFPSDKSARRTSGFYKFYFSMIDGSGYTCDQKTIKPSQSVKDFKQ